MHHYDLLFHAVTKEHVLICCTLNTNLTLLFVYIGVVVGIIIVILIAAYRFNIGITLRNLISLGDGAVDEDTSESDLSASFFGVGSFVLYL